MKRFYTDASSAAVHGAWQVQLDGRGLKTVGGSDQLVSSQPLSKALADEWAQQGETIEPASFVFRDMADYAIDVIAADPDALIDKLIGYAETDTLCYRAAPDEPLFNKQEEVWEPLLGGFEAREGVQMQRISGVVHQPQPKEALARLRDRAAGLDPLTLAALEQLVSLSASFSIGLSALEADADADALWNAAQLEEDWQAELWGRDAEAQAHAETRFAAFTSALEFAQLARG